MMRAHRTLVALGRAAVRRSAARAFTSSLPRLGVVPFKLADIGEGIAEVEVMSVFVSEGDTVAQFDNVYEVQSDKATVEISSRYDGVVKKVHYEVGDMVKVGAALLDIETEGGDDKDSAPAAAAAEEAAAPAAAAAAATPEAAAATGGRSNRRITFATPAVRALAKEHGVDLADVAGTGSAGRVLKDDLLAHVGLGAAPAVAAPVLGPPAAADVVVPVRGIQRMMVKSMNQSLTVPHFKYRDEIDLTNLVAMKPLFKAAGETAGVKVSYMPFLLKGLSLALLDFPQVNASFDPVKEELRQHGHHHIGVAMDTPRGLLVPHIKDVQSKSVIEIAADLNRLQRLGAENKLGEAELVGATTVVSNMGSIGGTYMSPVITPPQVSICALGKIERVPKFKSPDSDEVVAAHVMGAAWAADHRVLDGATVARFCNKWKLYLENPEVMAMHMK